MKKMPKQDKHNSKQDYETPRDVTLAVERRWGMLNVDLAASLDNFQAPVFYTEEDDSLKQDWNQYVNHLCWLNPPFKNIEPWVKKANESTNKIIMLTPASVGSNWFAKYCHNQCKVYFIRPRITFVGAKDPFPKDCMLMLWRIEEPGYDIWKYK